MNPQKVVETSEIQNIIKENKSSAQLVSLVEPIIAQPTGIVSENKDAADLARRYSLSLRDRTPPKGSIAEDLLLTSRPVLEKTNLMINELKDQLSDFASCMSSQASSDDSNNEKDSKSDSFQTVNEKKRIKKSKRRHKMTPTKEMFLKKPNLAKS